MSRSIQWRIAVPFILIVLIGMAVLGVYLASFAGNLRLDDIGRKLEDEARLTAEAALPIFAGQPGDLDTLAKRLGAQIDARVTIIAPDGTVLGDSAEDPAGMENHSNRPEVIAALAGDIGRSTRFSATLGQDMMYVAVRIESGGWVYGVSRVALPLSSVDALVNHLTLVIGLAVMAMATLTVAAAAVIARTTTRSLRELTEASARIACGDLGHRVPVRTYDETGRLAEAFNEMSSRLSLLLGEVSTERSRLATILANIADAIIMTDAEGRITLANPASERLFSFHAAEVSGKSLIEVVHDHEADDVLKRSLATHQTQTTQFESALSRRFVRAIAVPVTGDGHTGTLLLFQDLTELRNLQTMRRELVGNISHELRTPIAGIKAMVETLKEGAINDKRAAADFLSRIDDEIDRLTQMVAELTELSRIESGRAELKIEPVALAPLVGEVINLMEPLARKRDITIDAALPPALPQVNADKERIRQTLINLVHNAIKFNRDGGRVTVAARADTKNISVSVSDTGIGISREDLPHVFERFFKADKARTRGGSGLGLAIVKHTVQAHGGGITAQSEEGKGSTFTFTLPLK